MVWNYTTLKLRHTVPDGRRVLLPYEITLLSNWLYDIIPSNQFYYLMKLHYSQTFYIRTNFSFGFTTLWNYTTLKPFKLFYQDFIVLLPYEITLLSNDIIAKIDKRWVLLPYEITLLSNDNRGSSGIYLFYYLMKLHYSQTLSAPRTNRRCFTTLWNYTTLKPVAGMIALVRFYYLMKLHYSQTLLIARLLFFCFTTLWNYTTLKHEYRLAREIGSFTTLWNYTTLKPSFEFLRCWQVLLPYEITLLSNFFTREEAEKAVLLPYEITLLSNRKLILLTKMVVLLPYEITLLSNLKWE